MIPLDTFRITSTELDGQLEPARRAQPLHFYRTKRYDLHRFAIKCLKSIKMSVKAKVFHASQLFLNKSMFKSVCIVIVNIIAIVLEQAFLSFSRQHFYL